MANGHPSLTWKSKIGSSMVTLGKSLMGIGVVPQLSGEPNQVLTYIAILGFVLDAIGGFLRDIFSIDHSSVVKMIERASNGGTVFVNKEDSKEK